MNAMEVIYRCVSGLDVHKKTVVACRRRLLESGKVEKEIKTFATTTAALLALLEWLREWQVGSGVGATLTQVAMASTGVYWKPIWNILEGHLDLLLVNARHIKTVPGRKTDVKDCEWIAQLMQYGLLRASFVPSPEVRQWRDLTRHRTKLSDQRTAVINRLHKVLEDANVKLSTVISDLMGASGRRMLRALADGERDPLALSAMGDKRLKATPEELQASLLGQVQEHHRLMLATLLDQLDFVEQQMTRFDERLEVQMRPFETVINRLDTIDGIDRWGAQCLLAEWGPDMAQYPSVDHLSSWAGMWPGNDASAGKRRSGKTPKGNKWLRRTLTQAAWAATKRKGGYLSAQYRQLSARRGKKRAIVALGHTILIAAYHMLKDEGMSKDWVRHEVAAIIVVRRIIGDTTRCPISGILRRGAGRRRPVQSLRTMYPQSQTGIGTVRPRCLCQHQDGAGARMSGMANTCERSINIVTDNKPKMLKGLSQKGNVAGTRTLVFLVMGHQRYRWRERS